MPTSYQTAYVPSVHGFHFANDFRFEAGALNFWGRCNGMSWVSLDYFKAGGPAPGITEVEFENRPRSGPAAATNDGTVQLFCLQDGPFGDRPAGRVLQRDGSFSKWNYCAAGTGRHAPAAAVWPSGRTHLLAVGNDDQIYHCDFDGVLAARSTDCDQPLPGFSFITGTTGDAPALTAPFEGRLEAYAVGKDDHALYFRFYEDASWRGWAPLGCPDGITFNSSPAAVGWRGFMSVFARGSDNAMWQRVWQDGNWQPWQSLGGIFTSGPAACKVWDGRLHVFGRGTDGAIWANTWDNGWDVWQRLSPCPVGLTTDAPAAVGGDSFVHVYAKASDEKFWRLRWQAGAWQPWERVDNGITADSRRLTDAIMDRMTSTTLGPLIAATAPAGIGLPFLGPVRNFVTWRTPSDDDCYHWSSTDELRKLIGTLRAGAPLPLGLIDYEGWGHEVVACGLESDIDLPPGSYEDYALPGGRPWRIKIYDPNYPGCDNVYITLDPNSTDWYDGRLRRIRQSTGEYRRGFFVRDDYTPAPPPV